MITQKQLKDLSLAKAALEDAKADVSRTQDAYESARVRLKDARDRWNAALEAVGDAA